MSFIDLEEQLRKDLSPFQLNTSTTIENNLDFNTHIYLYVVNNSSIYSKEIQDQTVMDECDQSSLIDSNRDESNDFMNVNSSNSDTSQDNNDYLPIIAENLSSMKIPFCTQSQHENSISNRLYFSLDVNPCQRNIYKSDEFKIRSEGSNGRIVFIQGRKTHTTKMTQVLPKLRIPFIGLEPNVRLIVAAVSEQVSNGRRIWYKNHNKGFLPAQYTKDTTPTNPISINLQSRDINDEMELILRLHMITKWDKSKQSQEIIYGLDEESVVKLHLAAHEESSPRLLCVLQRNGNFDWNTFCLSDFIRSPKTVKKQSLKISTEPIDLHASKRLKTMEIDQALQ